MAVNNSSNIPAPVINTLFKRFLSVEEPNLIHGITATFQELPEKGGQYMTWRRHEKFGHALNDLGESGVDPDPVIMRITDVNAKVKWYGMYANIQEQIQIQNQDSILNAFTKNLGISMRESEDILIRDKIATTSTSVNCTRGPGNTMPTALSTLDIMSIVNILNRNSAKYVSKGIEGADRYGTGPVRDAFFALMSTEIINDLEDCSQYKAKWDYSYPEKALDSEWGAVKNVRFLVSPLGSVSEQASTTGTPVFNVLFPAIESYGVVEQSGSSAQLIYTAPNVNSRLNLFASLGYKFTFACAIFQDLWLGKLRATKFL